MKYRKAGTHRIVCPPFGIMKITIRLCFAEEAPTPETQQ